MASSEVGNPLRHWFFSLQNWVLFSPARLSESQMRRWIESSHHDTWHRARGYAYCYTRLPAR